MALPKLGLSMLYCLGEPFQEMIDRLTKAEVEYVEIVDDCLYKHPHEYMTYDQRFAP